MSSSDEADQEMASLFGVGEDFESSGPKRQDSESSLPTHKKSKRKDPKRDLTEGLVEWLSDSRKVLKQLQAAVVEASTSAGPSTSRLSERETWAQWMASVHEDIPPELWRAYQQETFLVAMRYVWQYQATQQHQPLQQQQNTFMAPQPPSQQHQKQFLVPQWPQQQRVPNLHAPHQLTFQRLTLQLVRSAPLSTTSCQHTSPGVLSQAMATLDGNTSRAEGMNFSNLFGSAFQTQTSTTTGLTDSFSEVVDCLICWDSGQQAQSHTQDEN